MEYECLYKQIWAEWAAHFLKPNPTLIITSMQGKRRPLSNHKRLSRSLLDHPSVTRPTPLPNSLLSRKYFLPLLQQDERSRSQAITRFLEGYRSADPLSLAEVGLIHSDRQLLRHYWTSAESRPFLQAQPGQQQPLPMHFHGQAFRLLIQCRRRKREGRWRKLQSATSTDHSSGKELRVLSGLSEGEESKQLGKLARCLRKVVGKQQGGRNYRVFLEEMERATLGKQRKTSEGMIRFIINIERDFSSIHQEPMNDFSKESIYGLSELKKKSEHHHSKLEPAAKGKEKRGTLGLLRADFGRKPKEQESSNCASNSKASQKSSSVRSRKGVSVQSGSKSKSKQKKTLRTGEKKSKLTDTQRLYFDEPEKSDPKSSLKKPEQDQGKARKKLGKK